FPSFLPWLAPAVAVAGLAAVVLLVLTRPGRPRAGGRLALAGPAVSLAALLIAPGAWTVQVFNPAYRGTAAGAVGPSGSGHGHHRTSRKAWPDGRALGPQSSRGGTDTVRAGGGSGFGGIGSDGRLTAAQHGLLAYTRAHQGSATYVFASGSWSTASPYILASGARVLPLGGFSGRAPFPSQSRFRQLVDTGRVRYVLLGGGRGTSFLFGGTGGTAAAQITGWVRASCTEVPASAYGGAAPSPAGGAGRTATAPTLYRCGPGQ
ncbi:mannosyltransferase, partial [Streptomyces sp. AF1A]